MQLRTSQINPRRIAALAAIVCGLGALPSAADAATVFKNDADNDILFAAAPGEDNDVLVSLTIGGVVVSDPNAPVTTIDPDCQQLNPHAVECDDTGTALVQVAVNDGVNKVDVGLPYSVRISAAADSTNEFWGGDGDDRLTGGDGADRLNGGDGLDTLEGEGGADILKGWDGADTLLGGDGADTLVADLGNDVLDGGDDGDYADYSDRPKSVSVSLDDVDNDGSRFIVSEKDNVMKTVENVLTGSGDDHVVGSERDNLITTGAGDDRVEAGEGKDAVYGMEGDDRLRGDEDDDTVVGDSNGGPAGADDLGGGAGDDRVFGRAGDDLVAGNAGRDDIYGGDGVDTATYADATAAVSADLDGVTFDDGSEGEGDTLGADVENLVGSPFDDRLGGGAGVNALSGGAGNDTIDSRDAAADSVDCGDGDADNALADGADSVTGCELPKAAPAGGGEMPGQPGGPGQPGLPAGPLLSVGPKSLRLDAKGYAGVKVSCPKGAAAACTGTLTAKVKGKRIAGAKFTVKAGSTKVVKIRVASAWRKRVARGAVKTSVAAVATAGQTQARTTTRAITFKAPLKKKRR